ncbi:MAG: hypothetical protein ACO3ZD_04390 [Cyanobium sp.]
MIGQPITLLGTCVFSRPFSHPHARGARWAGNDKFTLYDSNGEKDAWVVISQVLFCF